LRVRGDKVTECPVSGQEAPLSNALIPVAPSERTAAVSRSTGRAPAHFIAHLIAMSSQAPQTRVHRRAAPQDAIAAYAGFDRSPMPSGRALSRSI
jgi:hypothetical protein